VENNAFGTIKVAQAAAESEVESCVLIYTDKAVRPASVLGVTKRVAELTICALQKKHGTKFVAVRFGNVLGSSGSVVPIFMGQIENGGPVTVTHPEMRRYFMTASEAVQLVLQASVLGKGGEVFVLNMGEPVRIVDLARSLIVSSGLEPDRDIRIEFTGMRPGEKLFEELTFDNERLSATVHPKIFSLVRAQLADAADVSELLHELRQSLDARNLSQMILLLKKLVPDYVPSCELPCGMMPGESDSSSVEVIEPSCGEVREGEQVSALPEEETAVCAARGRS
jgi:FlaA1/EpsC-like NDP-sugar epimerase